MTNDKRQTTYTTRQTTNNKRQTTRYYRPRHAPRVVVGRSFDTLPDPFRHRLPQSFDSFDETLRVVVARRFDRQSFDEILPDIVAPSARLDEIVDLTFRQRPIVSPSLPSFSFGGRRETKQPSGRGRLARTNDNDVLSSLTSFLTSSLTSMSMSAA